MKQSGNVIYKAPKNRGLFRTDFGNELIPAASNRLDHGRSPRVVIELAPQSADQDIDASIEAMAGIAPTAFYQLLAA